MPDGEEMEDGDAALGCGGDGEAEEMGMRHWDVEEMEDGEMGMRHWDAEETGMGADGDGEVDADGCASSVRDREDKPLEIFFPSTGCFLFFTFLFVEWETGT